MSISAAQAAHLIQSAKQSLLQQHDTPQAAAAPAGLFAKRLDAVLERQTASGPLSQELAQQAAKVLQLSSMRSSLELLSPETGADATTALPSSVPLLTRTLSSLQPYLESQAGTASAIPAAERAKATVVVEQSEVSLATERQAERPERSATGHIASLSLEQLIERASRRYGVEASLIRAVIKAESNFNPRAVSAAGAQGLMQLMPATAKGLGVTNSFDPEQNVMAGTRFLKTLLDRYDGNLDAALAAYNWGPGNLDRSPDRLPRETRDYLARVKQYYTASDVA